MRAESTTFTRSVFDRSVKTPRRKRLWPKFRAVLKKIGAVREIPEVVIAPAA